MCMLLVLKLLNLLRVTQSTLHACITEGLALQLKKNASCCYFSVQRRGLCILPRRIINPN
jgi:hypothetical protein